MPANTSHVHASKINIEIHRSTTPGKRVILVQGPSGHDGKFETCDLLTFTPSHCGGVNVSMLCLTSHNEVT